MITLPIGLDEEIVKKIDALVKKGIYKNRSEALRDQIVKGLAKIELIDDETPKTESYQQLLRNLLLLRKPPNLLPTQKSITEIVSEARER